MRPFEIALIGIFGIAAIGGLFYFGKHRPAEDPLAKMFGESVVIWGTFDELKTRDFFAQIVQENDTLKEAFQAVSYKQIDERSFTNTLVNAIAEGEGPDLIIMPNSQLVTYRSKLYAFPPESETMNKRIFNDLYIDGADIFIRNDGIYGIPLGVDPLLMYWNRDIFSSSGLSTPPKTWETLVSQTIPAVNRFDGSSNFKQNTVALGEFNNVTNAKNILTALFFQAGTDIVIESDDRYVITLDKEISGAMPAGKAGLSFYSQFASPSKSAYSWSRARRDDRSEFIGGTLGLYFGMASERDSIERDNANLNYDVAVIPQGSGANVYRTYGDFYAFAIPRSSKNIQGAYAVATFLSEPLQAKELCEMYKLSPVRRSMLGGNETDSFKSILYQSALIAHGWLDPSPTETTDIFQVMIEDANLQGAQFQSVVTDAVSRLESLF